MTDVHCAKCDRLMLPSDLATSGFPRPPCPNCGATSLAISASISVQARAHVEIYGELVPGDQARGWERRWKNLKNSLQGLTQPVFGVMSGDAIHADAQRLLAFFVDAYNLKDALKAEASLGINPQAVEDDQPRSPTYSSRRFSEPRKAHHLSKPPRSGIAPSVAQIVGQDVRGTKGWRPLWSPFAMARPILMRLKSQKMAFLGGKTPWEIWGSFRPPSVSLCTLLLI